MNKLTIIERQYHAHDKATDRMQEYRKKTLHAQNKQMLHKATRNTIIRNQEKGNPAKGHQQLKPQDIPVIYRHNRCIA